MASTTAMFTGLSGLNANSRNLDVIGNNIANVNTTAFKSNRMLFSTVMSRTYSLGSPPGDVSGGSNPTQVGLGVKIGGTQRNFSGGTISPTGDPRDLAIEGDGFFVVNRGGQDFFTRAGAFRPNRDGFLTTLGGETLRGYAIDDNFNIQSGALVDLSIPLGRMTVAEATRNVVFAGNLNADGPLPTQGSRISLGGTETAGFIAVAGANPAPLAGNRVEGTTRLVDLEDPAQPGSGTSLFSAGQSIELNGADKGAKTIPTATFAITAATTLDDLRAFLEAAMGIDPAAGANPDGSTPGVTIDPITGQISVVGHPGDLNDLTIDQTDLRLVDASGALVSYPFVSNKLESADGESVRTTFVVFDSLGTPVEVDLTMHLESRSSTGTQWRYTIDSGDDSDLAFRIASGVINFDTQGQIVDTTPVTIRIDRAGSGADTPLEIDLRFAEGDQAMTALTDSTSTLAAVGRDGAPIGTLSAFGFGTDGTIVGSFTNGLVRPLGQLAIATFSNTEGLVDAGNNLFSTGVNSGPAITTTAGSMGTGQVIGGALELSNVDLGEEFIKMILSSTGYSASSRVIRTADELMQQLLVLGR